MPRFSYKAYGQAGGLAEGEIEAASSEAATATLWAQKLVPFQMTPADNAAKPWWQRELFADSALSSAQLAAFTREFATLITAGIPLDDALRILGEQTASGKARPVAEALLANILKGGSLSEAIEKRPADFPAEYVSVVRAGETGGRLGPALEELATLLERRSEVRAKVQSALVYPAILVLLSLGALGMIVGVLIPSIAPVFGEGGRPVPGTIRFLMTLHGYWLEIIIGIAAAGLGALAAGLTMLRQPAKRLAFDRFALRLPLLGPFLLRQETARYARTLGTLLKAGVPLLPAAVSARAALGNAALSAGAVAATDAIREGSSLHAALRGHTVFPPLMFRMIAIGEETAKLDSMLVRVAVMLEQQTQRDMERFMTVFTPAITVLVAAFIGALIVTIMTAILSLNDLAIQ